jgi:hypothetical protein
MGTLAMRRTLAEAGIPDGQADAIVKVIQGDVATKQDLGLLETRLGARIDKLDSKVNLVLVGVVLAVVVPAVVRLGFG